MDRKQLTKAAELLEQARTRKSPGITSAYMYDRDALKGTSLEKAPDLSLAFEKASNPAPEDRQIGEGSQQVRESGPAHEMRPPPEIAREPDRQKHSADMQRDDQAAKEARYRDIMQSFQDRSGPQDRGRENDELSLG